MSPEIGILIFVTLLWGPTALWLGYRAIRGPQRRVEGSDEAFSGSSSRSQAAPDPVEVLIGPDGFWICASCRSVNRPGAGRCYGCRAARDAVLDVAPDAAPDVAATRPGTERWVPVMAESPRRTPVMAEPVAAPAAAVVGTAAALAAVASLPREQAMAAREPDETPAMSAPGVAPEVMVCPFLGWKDDLSTRFDFPDPMNRCHANPDAVAASLLPRGRPVSHAAPAGRSRTIDAEHQRTHCLTTAHRQCARYPAVDEVPAKL